MAAMSVKGVVLWFSTDPQQSSLGLEALLQAAVSGSARPAVQLIFAQVFWVDTDLLFACILFHLPFCLGFGG